MTLRQWYNLFNVTGTKEIYLKAPPGVKNGSKGSSFCLELFIHEDIVSFHFPYKELQTNLELKIHYFHSTMNEQIRMKKTLRQQQARNGKGGDLAAQKMMCKYPSEFEPRVTVSKWHY
jgi:hypothetical protein